MRSAGAPVAAIAIVVLCADIARVRAAATGEATGEASVHESFPFGNNLTRAEPVRLALTMPITSRWDGSPSVLARLPAQSNTGLSPQEHTSSASAPTIPSSTSARIYPEACPSCAQKGDAAASHGISAVCLPRCGDRGDAEARAMRIFKAFLPSFISTAFPTDFPCSFEFYLAYDVGDAILDTAEVPPPLHPKPYTLNPTP